MFAAQNAQNFQLPPQFPCVTLFLEKRVHSRCKRIMQTDKRDWKKILKIVGNVLVIISIVFLAKRIINMDIDYREVFSAWNVLRLLPVLLIAVVQIMTSFFPWWIITISMTGFRVSPCKMCKSFTKANIMKYIPGNVFQYVGRAELAEKDKNITVPIVAIGVILESISMVIAALIIGFWGLGSYALSVLENNKVIILVLVIIIVACLAALYIFRGRIGGFLEEKNIFISWKLAAGFGMAVLYFSLSHMAGGVMLSLIMQILSGQKYIQSIRLIAGSFAIGWVTGYLTPGASGGIGVRETILFLLLSNITDSEVVLLSPLVLRFINILSDLISYCLMRVIGRKV